jgi:hypothetical protein
LPLKQTGSFVFNQVHSILEGIPPENGIAMYDAKTVYDAVNGM